MNRGDIGKIYKSMRVIALGRSGVVESVHEPQWRDHKTRAWQRELQGADIRFDGDAFNTYVHCADIEIASPC